MGRLTPSDEQVFVDCVGRLGVDAEAARAALSLVELRLLARGEYLLRGGERAVWTGVLVSGLLREHFVTSAGVERTKSFVMPLQFTGSLADLLSGEPSRCFIVAEEPSRLLLVRYDALRALEASSPTWARANRRSAERLVMYKAEREYQFLCLDAAERYAAFGARHPGLESRVALRHIASYLGITPVHLSRLRARRVRTQSPNPPPTKR